MKPKPLETALRAQRPIPTDREPLPVELLASDDERRTATIRARCLKLLVALAGDAGLREFLRQRQPGFGDMSGGQLLQQRPHELLERLAHLSETNR